MQKKLYLVLLGGKHPQANIEVHDIRMVVCEHVADAYTLLKQQWFGIKKGVHIDGWMQVNGVDYDGKSYAISIESQPSQSIRHGLKLYFINLGAYVPYEFGEVHKYFVVAGKNKVDAKLQGKKQIEKIWFKPHTDAVIDVDECIELSFIDAQHIVLTESSYAENTFKNDYIVLE